MALGSLLSGLGVGLASSAGSLMGSLLSYSQTKKLMQKQNDFTERMSNTAHTREVADLRNAGLNPILSVTGGSGASTPSSGTGAVIGNDLGSGVASALDFKRLQNETQLKDSQTHLNNSAVDLNRSQEWFNRAHASLVQEQARNESERYNNIVAERASILQNIKNQTDIAKAQVRNLNSASFGRDLENEVSGKYVDWLRKNPKLRDFDYSSSTARHALFGSWSPNFNSGFSIKGR